MCRRVVAGGRLRQEACVTFAHCNVGLYVWVSLLALSSLCLSLSLSPCLSDLDARSPEDLSLSVCVSDLDAGSTEDLCQLQCRALRIDGDGGDDHDGGGGDGGGHTHC